VSSPGRSPRAGARLALTLAALGAVIVACAPSTPSPSIDASRALHIVSRVSNAVSVHAAGMADDPPYEDVLQPCDREVVLTAGREIPATDAWSIGLIFDPLGAFDAEVAGWSGDRDTMPEPAPAQASILWSRGDIATADLPAWVIVEPDGVTMASAAPGPAPSTCEPVRQ
jgi:hypothetical protein